MKLIFKLHIALFVYLLASLDFQSQSDLTLTFAAVQAGSCKDSPNACGHPEPEPWVSPCFGCTSGPGAGDWLPPIGGGGAGSSTPPSGSTGGTSKGTKKPTSCEKSVDQKVENCKDTYSDLAWVSNALCGLVSFKPSVGKLATTTICAYSVHELTQKSDKWCTGYGDRLKEKTCN